MRPVTAASHPQASPVVCVGREVWNLQRLGIRLVLLLIEGDPLLLIPDGTDLWRRILRWAGLTTVTKMPVRICLGVMGRAEPPQMSYPADTGSCTHSSCFSVTWHWGGFPSKFSQEPGSMGLRFGVTGRVTHTALSSSHPMSKRGSEDTWAGSRGMQL